MKVSVYLKKSDSQTSNICFRVREKNVDIKVVSPLAVYDKYWDADTLSYRRTTAVPATEQKRLPEQIAAIIERVEKTFSDKANSKWLKQAIEDVLYPVRAFERNHPNLLCRIHEYLEKFDGAERTKEHHTLRAQDVTLPRLPTGDTGQHRFHPLCGNRHTGTDERFPGLCRR